MNDHERAARRFLWRIGIVWALGEVVGVSVLLFLGAWTTAVTLVVLGSTVVIGGWSYLRVARGADTITASLATLNQAIEDMDRLHAEVVQMLADRETLP